MTRLRPVLALLSAPACGVIWVPKQATDLLPDDCNWAMDQVLVGRLEAGEHRFRFGDAGLTLTIPSEGEACLE